MKNLNKFLKTWNAKFQSTNKELQWNKWLSFKAHRPMKDFIDLINSDVDDYFKFRALLLVIVPGYWRSSVDSDQRDRNNYHDDFSVEYSKLSEDLINFASEAVCIILSEIHSRIIESLPKTGSLSFDRNDNLSLSSLGFHLIDKLNEIHENFYGKSEGGFSTLQARVLFYHRLAADLLCWVDEERGQLLLENFFAVRPPLFLDSACTRFFSTYEIAEYSQIFQKRVTKIFWLQKFARALFALSQQEKNKSKQKEIVRRYASLVEWCHILKISEKEREKFFTKEISFLFENENWKLLQGNEFFDFGFRNRFNSHNPESKNLRLLQNNPQLLSKLLKKFILPGGLVISSGNIDIAQYCMESFKNSSGDDYKISKSFSLAINQYLSDQKKMKENQIKAEKDKVKQVEKFERDEKKILQSMKKLR